MSSKIAPCLWFDTQAEEAARYYTGIFKNSKITMISRYPADAQGMHRERAGTVLTVAFELNGQSFTALNGGPQFQFSPAVSLIVECEDQAEIDYYWEKLSAGGDPTARQCGWVEDKFGFSWQIVPKIMPAMLTDPDLAKTSRTFQAVMGMKKLDIAALQRAFAG